MKLIFLILFLILNLKASSNYVENDALYDSLEKPQDSETEDTLKQYAKSLFNFKAYNANYFLPLSYRYNGNYSDTNGHKAKKTETEFQFSVKFDFAKNVFGLDGIYSIDYTQNSFWQFYSDSAFFRESNYAPEFFVIFPTSSMDDKRFIKALRFGLANESNGRGGAEERSWNYINGSIFFQYKMLFSELKLWARLPNTNDYNPELINYMGHGYIKFMLPYKKHFVNMKFRYNFNKKGSAELNYTYPMFGRNDLFLYIKLFNGYGESLIDYDDYIKKFGIGFSISR
ncbi:MAG: phospholipase [Sulfurimonas sp.]|nr:MAG: phospholipase [Sulfurimonas sp.]